MSVCPKCGVAVVPGYVRCPKCQTALPQRRSSGTTVAPAGGTTVSSGGGEFPLLPVLGGVALLALIVGVVVMRGGDSKPATTAPRPTSGATEPVVADPTPDEPDPTPTATPTSATPDPTSAINDLDRALKRERLWGTVEVVGARIDVRSGSCADPTMSPVLDAAGPPLRKGGLTKLRCLEQSGAVVFERDL